MRRKGEVRGDSERRLDEVPALRLPTAGGRRGQRWPPLDPRLRPPSGWRASPSHGFSKSTCTNVNSPRECIWEVKELIGCAGVMSGKATG